MFWPSGPGRKMNAVPLTGSPAARMDRHHMEQSMRPYYSLAIV